MGTWLILGRVSNLPTVWSNLLVGWCLEGGGVDVRSITILLFGGSLLYIGGMFLNDFCDADFDSRYRPERPIPAGVVSRGLVGWIAGAEFFWGMGLLSMLGGKILLPAFLLLGCIILYDVVHKKTFLAPFLMGACRVLLYFLGAAAVGHSSGTGLNLILAGLALGLYVVGITFFARSESRPDTGTRWSWMFLFLPVLNVSTGDSILNGLYFFLFAGLLLVWMGWLLGSFFLGSNRSVGRVVSGLLAAIVLVDCLMVAPVLGFQTVWFLIFFVLAILLQRIIPAT